MEDAEDNLGKYDKGLELSFHADTNRPYQSTLVPLLMKGTRELNPMVCLQYKARDRGVPAF